MLDLLFSIAIWGAVVCNLFLGLLVFTKNLRNPININFAGLAIVAAFWAFGLFFYQHPVIFPSFVWLKAVYVDVIFLMGVILSFSFFFPSGFSGRLKSFLIPFLLYIIPGLVFFWLIIFTNLFINNVVQESFGPRQILGPIYPFFALWSSSIFGWGAFNFFQSYKKASGLKKLQLRYLFGGMFLFSLIPITLDVIFPIFFADSRYIWISPISGVFLIGGIGYAIIAHRVLDIRFVIARIIAYSVLLLTISICYAGTSFLIDSVLSGLGVSTSPLIVYTALTVLVALFFERIKLFLEKITDRFFFKGHYDSARLLSSLSRIMSTNIELSSLTSNVVDTLLSGMRVSRGGIVLLEGNSVSDVIDRGFLTEPILYYQKLSPFLSFYSSIVFDELKEGNFKQLMRDLSLEVARVLRVKDEVVGILVLGEKLSGEIYSQQDLQVLEILAPEMAVAIKNSESYDKIKRFNLILSDEVKKATVELQDANSRLKQLDRLKDDFVSITSHELRTPMTAIRSYAWMALYKSDMPLSEKMKKYLIRVLLSTERLINLVNDMLNLSRIESGKIEINPESIDLTSLIKDIVDELYFSKSREKQIQFVVLEKLMPKAFADPEKLRQVFLNIVGNALKFTPHGGKIIFDFFTDSQEVAVSVTDTGVGIAREDVGRLFFKFGRLDNSYTAAATSGGTGLGLYISKNLVELMHGRIWAQSEGVGKGTTFIIALPIATKERIEHASEYSVKPKEGEAKPLEPVGNLTI